jgi:hypothetical protein
MKDSIALLQKDSAKSVDVSFAHGYQGFTDEAFKPMVSDLHLVSPSRLGPRLRVAASFFVAPGEIGDQEGAAFSAQRDTTGTLLSPREQDHARTKTSPTSLKRGRSDA